MSTSYKFEVVIIYAEDVDLPTEDELDMGALYYGDEHQGFVLKVVPGTIKEIKK